MIAALATVAILTASDCHPIQTEKIHGRDLASALPAFAALPADAEFGYAPNPGQERIFRTGELRRIASAYHVDFRSEANACFTWPTSVPDREKLLEAMKTTLAGREAKIEIVEQSQNGAPQGEIVFPASGISQSLSDTALWHGYVKFAGERRFPIWARVRLIVREVRVKAIEDLRPGEPIAASQVRLETYEGPLTRDVTATALSDVIGMIPRNGIAANSYVQMALLSAPQDVQRGDSVQVVVPMANGRIETQGIAEAGGMRGTVITVRNTKSGKTFRARIEDRGKVVVVPAGAPGLAVEGKQS